MTQNQLNSQFAHLHSMGWTIHDLCKKFGICKSTAYNWIRKYAPVKRTKGRTITAHDFYQLERENKTLRAENEIFRRCGCSLVSPLVDKLAAIDRLKSEFTVHMLCQTFDVLKSSYYHPALRSPVKKWHELDDDELRPLIKEIFVNSRERFGAQKIKFILQQQGKNISRAHISRLIQEMNLVCK